MELYIEIRAGEGGDDSKLFCNDLAKSYEKMAIKNNCEISYQKIDPGIVILKLSGKNLNNWKNEAGGHRIQRCPPTERNGRVHTSTVTVAVMNKIQNDFKVNDNDIRIEWYSGTGKGGQNRNKLKCCARLIYIPTGIVKTAQTRSRENSYKLAYDALIKELEESYRNTQYDEQSSIRKEQVGSGMRADKIRTIRFRDNQAIDHRTNKICTADQYMKGEMSRLWPNE